MSYMPQKKLTLEEVQKMARQADGQTARDALLAADKVDGPVQFIMAGKKLKVVKKK